MSHSQLSLAWVVVRAVSIVIVLAALYGACVMILTVQSNSAASLFAPKAAAKITSATPEKTSGLQSAENERATPIAATQTPVLVEMFLSQSCSSCVPAAAYVRELAQRDDVVVLSWHVDYWDTLSVGRHGKWKDPYSSPDYTQRQRTYARKTFDPRRVYTPQAVVAGRAEFVGARRGEINAHITQTHKDQAATQVQIVRPGASTMAGQLQINVTAPPSEARLRVVEFLPSTQTSILGGENAGVNWREANVVVASKTMPLASTGEVFLATADYQSVPGAKCAILVENKNAQAIAAAYC
ncbi:MAG: DUF1223 domain-containing protein [Pseudomonadota bacterium]